VQLVLHVEQALGFALFEAGQRHTGDGRDGLCNHIFIHGAARLIGRGFPGALSLLALLAHLFGTVA